jgi:hypothetical protein
MSDKVWLDLGGEGAAGMHYRYLLPYLVFCLVMGISSHATGAEGVHAPSRVIAPSPATSEEVSSEVAEDASNEDLLADRLHQTISRGILKTAETIDGFFYAPRTEIEDNRTTFKLTLDLFAEADEGAQLGTGTRLKLVLPGFQDRLHLVLAGDPKEDDKLLGERIDEAPEAGLEADEDTDGVSAALRYFALDDIKRNLSISAGVRIRDSQLVGFPEVRYRRAFDPDDMPMAFRFQQRVVWYTDEGWQESTAIDMDLMLLGRFLWRSSLEGVWAEEALRADCWGYRYDLRFTLFQPLWKRAALRYEWNNEFNLCTVDQLDRILLRVRYRQNIWRPWLFFEAAPQLSFPESDDFSATPGILFRLEAILGHYSKAAPAK